MRLKDCPREEAQKRFSLGEWSESQYEEWAVAFFALPTAPYVDFKRYTKCVDPGWFVPLCREKKPCLTPEYKRRRRPGVLHASPRRRSAKDLDNLVQPSGDPAADKSVDSTVSCAPQIARSICSIGTDHQELGVRMPGLRCTLVMCPLAMRSDSACRQRFPALRKTFVLSSHSRSLSHSYTCI